MEDQLKRLVGFVARSLKKTEDEVAEAISSDEAVRGLSQDFADHIQTVDTNAYKRAELKIKKTTEQILAAKGLKDVSFDKLGEALDVLEQQAREKGGTALSEEEIMRLPAVVKLKNTHATEKEQIATAAKLEERNALATERQQFQQQQQAVIVRAAAEAKVRELNPNLGDNPTIAANRFEELVDKIVSGNYKVEGQQIIPLKPGTDEYLTDEKTGHTIKFEDTVRGTVTRLYELPVATDRQSPGLTPEQVAAANRGTNFTHFKGKAPKTEQEYVTLANDPNLPPAALKEVQAYWGEQAGK